jgi:hypothetical protein
MNDYDWENRSSRLGPIDPSPVHHGSYRDWNQRTLIVEHVSNRSLGRHGDSAAQRLEALRPLPFNAAMDAQRVFRAHYVNLADTLLRAS